MEMPFLNQLLIHHPRAVTKITHRDSQSHKFLRNTSVLVPFRSNILIPILTPLFIHQIGIR